KPSLLYILNTHLDLPYFPTRRSSDLKGHEVHVFTRMGPDQSHYERIDGVHYHRCPFDLQPNFVDEDRRDSDGNGRRQFVRNAIGDRKSTRLNSSHVSISYAVFCLKKK